MKKFIHTLFETVMVGVHFYCQRVRIFGIKVLVEQRRIFALRARFLIARRAQQRLMLLLTRFGLPVWIFVSNRKRYDKYE